MGMGSIPCHADVISLENLRKLCPAFSSTSNDALHPSRLLEEFGGWGAAARHLDECGPDYDETCPLFLKTHYRELREEFNEVTGLTLFLNYYDLEAGDRYDELPDGEDGFYFSVDGVWQRTESGEKFKEYIMTGTWTVFG
jgi:hypothetical protein